MIYDDRSLERIKRVIGDLTPVEGYISNMLSLNTVTSFLYFCRSHHVIKEGEAGECTDKEDSENANGLHVNFL